MNLSLLGLVLLIFPSWRNLVINHLIKRRWTKLYFVMYYLTKAYLIGTKIYPMNYSARHILQTIKESFFSDCSSILGRRETNSTRSTRG